jgi:tetratricopeptide (TPR) repeat protein
VRLFAERAAAVQPGFRLTEANAAAVAEIVARLDGLPLALELAASRLRVLSPESLAERLGKRLPLLTGGALDAPERQRTLEGTIRWSDEALEPDDRRLFARLSVFVGGWTMEAAEALCGEGLDVLEGLTTLVDAGLVRRSDVEGMGRFDMLETIREYAQGRFETVETGEREDVQRRHTRFVLELAEEAEPHLTREEQASWMGILDSEHDNVRAALERAERGEDVQSGLRTAASVWRFWQSRGHLHEGGERLERLLALPEAKARDATRVRALGALGSIRYWLAEYDEMRSRYEEAVEIAREIGDRGLLSRALYDSSFVPMAAQGDLETAKALLREALEVAKEDDLWLRAQVWTSLGFTDLMAGNATEALEVLERGISLMREGGEFLALCEGLMALAGAEMLMGAVDAMRGHVAKATTIASGSKNPAIIATAVFPQAMLANLDGRFERAALLVGAWTRLQQDHDVRFPEAGLQFFGDPSAEPRARLGEEAFERARAEGAAMKLDDVVAVMMEDTPD